MPTQHQYLRVSYTDGGRRRNVLLLDATVTDKWVIGMKGDGEGQRHADVQKCGSYLETKHVIMRECIAKMTPLRMSRHYAELVPEDSPKIYD